jgi:hypothetical protein
LFFSRFNIRQIKRRQEATGRSENGVNGFRLRYIEGATPDEFGSTTWRAGSARTTGDGTCPGT